MKIGFNKGKEEFFSLEFEPKSAPGLSFLTIGLLLALVWAVFIIAVMYSIILAAGFKHYLNFIPSPQWTTISMVLSVIVGVFGAVPIAIYFICTKKKTRILDGIILCCVCAATISYFYDDVFVFGIGPAVTAFSISGSEKYVFGAKEHIRHRRGDDYVVMIMDVSLGKDTKIYISESEFKAIPKMVNMRAIIKQSFFGSTIESYQFKRML